MSHLVIYFFHLPVFRHFLTLPSTQTIKVIGLIFFLWAGLEKLGYEHAFQPYTYSLRPFSRGGGAKRPPRLYIDLDPPACLGLKWKENQRLLENNIFRKVLQTVSRPGMMKWPTLALAAVISAHLSKYMFINRDCSSFLREREPEL